MVKLHEVHTAPRTIQVHSEFFACGVAFRHKPFQILDDGHGTCPQVRYGWDLHIANGGTCKMLLTEARCRDVDRTSCWDSSDKSTPWSGKCADHLMPGLYSTPNISARTWLAVVMSTLSRYSSGTKQKWGPSPSSRASIIPTATISIMTRLRRVVFVGGDSIG